METWVLMGPVIVLLTAMMHSAALSPYNGYYFGRQTSSDFRKTDAGQQLALRFRLLLAAGTILTIFLNATERLRYHPLTFVPLFLGPALGWLWNWRTVRSYEIAQPSDLLPSPVRHEPLSAGIVAMLLLGPAVSIAAAVATPYLRTEGGALGAASAPVVFVCLTLKTSTEAYALSRRSRQFDTRLRQIRTLAGNTLLFGLFPTIVYVAMNLRLGHRPAWMYVILATACLAFLLWHRRQFPWVAAPKEAVPADHWLAGVLYCNPRDPSWIVCRPSGRSFAANVGIAPAWVLILPHALFFGWLAYLLLY